MKLLIRLFLSFCFLLISGYSQVSAYDGDQCVTLASPSKYSDLASLRVFHNASQPVISSALSANEKDNDLIDIADESDEDDEDKELTSYKKDLQLCNYFSTSCGHPSGHFFSSIKANAPFCRHYSYTSSSRYIVFRVFRV